MTPSTCRKALLFCLMSVVGACSRAEVLMQYFETEWDEIYRRLPEIAEIGYEGLWLPPPCKSPNAGGPFAGGGNVGYSHYDKFDIGDIPQRGSLGTRYGTRGSLRRMVDNAHQCDIKIYPDIVMNHYGNGPDFRTYPGTRPNDFHGWWDASQPGGFKRSPRMTAYDDISNGYGATFYQELVSLVDLQLEPDNRFSSGSPNFAYPPSFYRQPGRPEYYPYGLATNETTIKFINRWIAWLGYAMDWDGVRLDAPKHVIANFFGLPLDPDGFNHNIQYNFDLRRGYTDYTNYNDSFSQLYANYIHRDDALIFSEFFIGSVSQVDYWRNFGVKFRYLDFPRKSSIIFPAFNSGNLSALAYMSGFSEEEGVLFCHSHDESPPSKLELAYVYILTHVGLPVVYFTGNNLSGSDVNVRTWVKIGHGGALGDYNNNVIPNLVYIHNHFARGREYNRWNEGDYFVYERYEDLNTNGVPNINEGLLLVGFNDSGSWQTRTGVQTAFAPGTVLRDYTGNNPSNITVGANSQVSLSIPPGSGGQGWVCYAPLNASASGDPLRFSQGGVPCPTMSWLVPGGALATNKPRSITRITNDIVDIDVYFNPPPGGGVDNVLVKWGRGERVHATQPHLTNNPSLVSYGYQNAVSNPAYWRLTATLTNIAEGLHLVKGRCFNSRPAGYPALYQTFTEAVYVDRRGPDLVVSLPAPGQIVDGDVVAVISNLDRTAYAVDVQLDGGPFQAATKVMEGSWRFNLSGLSSGNHTMVVRALEADWGAVRSIINTSTLTRVFTVDTAGPPVSISFEGINRGVGSQIELPFFRTIINAPGLNQNQVTLLWDGFPLLLRSGVGVLTNVFDGQYVLGGVTSRLFGAFVNGTHFFEAVAVSGGLTNRATRQVTFNLYGSNQIDSDGDGLPDNIEMPNFSNGTAPGPNVPWPGDTSSSGNQDMVPNYGETWTRLNPMNADTDYDGIWDGDEDSDVNINSGDGVPNGCEVRQGYLQYTNPYYYNIYSASSKPTTCIETNGGAFIPSQVTWTPPNPTRCPGNTLTINYTPNQGPLSNQSPILIRLTQNNWTNSTTNTMTSIGGGTWQHVQALSTNATSLAFFFRNAAGTVVDNNGGTNWTVPIGACVTITNFFVMNGLFDSTNYEVAISGMKILAAVKGSNLYVATWSANGSETSDDHFLYVCNGFSSPMPTPWAKAGSVFFDTATMPYLSAESRLTNGYHIFNNGGTGARSAMGPPGAALEGELNLAQVFGEVPRLLYLAAVSMGDSDGGGVGSQCPPSYGNNWNDLETCEFLPVPVASIRDENLDGIFDIGKPQMWTVINGHTNDANYGLRRILLDERAGESQAITVILRINGPGGTNVISNVELFSNLNRREFAVLPGEEDPDTVTPGSATTYYRAYPMSGSGNGPYTITLTATKCGAYRINARYKINGGPYIYYSDGGLRRDCAVVVSPKKALDLVLYEMNPLIAEATSAEFSGRSTFRDLYTVNTDRPDVFNANTFRQMGVNMVWLQPIHPIGSDNRQVDPETGSYYDPGSPYAVRNYWQVNGVLGHPWTADGSQAMKEFTNFVQALDAQGVGVMLDGTFNHSAWDCEIGEVGVQMFSWATNASDLIRNIRPQWYSKAGHYGAHATYYHSPSDTDIAVAPDRMDFGKWNDAADFFFGTYDALVQGQTDAWRDHYLHERDVFDGFPTEATRELWQYLAYYPIYWIEKTGHPRGTPKTESYKGIDALRCDFAQGLPSLFWEYMINKTRSVKWDFLFMAESLDGYRDVGGSKRHGVGYRSARHFDIMNENLIFYWRDQFFDYKPWGGTPYADARPFTFPTWQAFDDRRNAYDVAPLLLDLICHDELYPHDDQWRVLYAYAIVSGMDGVPMLFYGQEAGAQNDAMTYTGRGINPANNFARYEMNFGKSIPNFKRYNHMTNIWNGLAASWKTPIYDTYRRINLARLRSPALRSQNNYMLAGTNGWNSNLFVTVRYEVPGVSAASQDVVIVAVNNNYQTSTNRRDRYNLNVEYAPGVNWFGIEDGRTYNVVDLMSPTPTNWLWSPSKPGTEVKTNFWIVLNGNPYLGQQAQYLKLVDVNASYPDYTKVKPWDLDNDDLPDAWERAYGLNPNSAEGEDGAAGDKDGDGMSNYHEWLAGTRPHDAGDVLKVFISARGESPEVSWPTKPEKNYRLEYSGDVRTPGASWQSLYFGTAFSDWQSIFDSGSAAVTSRFYRVRVHP